MAINDTMPNYFSNTSGPRPLSVQESRDRLKTLVSRPDEEAAPEADEPKPQIRSRILQRQEQLVRPTGLVTSDLAQAKKFQPLARPVEAVPAEVASYAEPQEPVKIEEFLAHQSIESEPQPRVQPAPPLERPPASVEHTPVEQSQIADHLAEIAEEPTVAEPEQISYKTYPIQSGQYWSHAWKDQIHDGHIGQNSSDEKVILEIAVPQDNEVEIPAAEQMYSGLTSIGQKPGFLFEMVVGMLPKVEIFFKNPEHAISWEIVADSEHIRFWVVVPKDMAEYIEREVHGSYPDADISIARADGFIQPEGTVAISEIVAKGKPYYPIRVAEDLGVDPLNAITSSMSKLMPGERVVLQMLIQPSDDIWRSQGRSYINAAQKPPKDEKDRRPNVDPKIIEGISNKLARPGFRTAIRILVQSNDPQQAKNITENLAHSFDQFDIPQMANLSKKHLKMTHENAESIIKRTFPKWGNYPVMNTIELATLYHFPNKEVQTPRLKWLRSRKSAPPTNVPTSGLYLGKSEFRATEVRVNVQREDRRRHLYVIGQTGTGKSEFLKFLAYQDIKNGDGLAFIDPHGEAVEDILNMIPKERAEDVIYFNPADSERPMGLNILDAKNEEGQHLVVNSFIGLLYKLYDPGHSGIIGPQLERTIRNVMLTAMAEPGNSMIEVLKLLINPKFAESKIPLIKDPLVKSFWTEQMAQTSDFHKSETLAYFVSKFDRFVTEKLMRNIIGQSVSSFDFRDVMDSKKILLVNLSKGMIGEENSNFLGLLIVPRILAAAMSRADMPNEDRKDFYLYVDEFQNFATPDFAQILAEARKYRLNLTVANQFIAQMKDEIKDAVFGNVGTMVSFRVGPDDGEYLEKQFDPVFKQTDLINLSMGECALRLLIGGQPSRPFSFKTDWPAIQAMDKNPKIGSVIKEISRLKYGRDRSIVESEIAVRAGF